MAKTTNFARLGYIVVKTGESRRVLPRAIMKKFEVSSGALVPPIEGSTKSMTVTNAGIANVSSL